MNLTEHRRAIHKFSYYNFITFRVKLNQFNGPIYSSNNIILISLFAIFLVRTFRLCKHVSNSLLLLLFFNYFFISWHLSLNQLLLSCYIYFKQGKSSSEYIAIEKFTYQYGLQLIINDSTHLLESSLPCIDLKIPPKPKVR